MPSAAIIMDHLRSLDIVLDDFRDNKLMREQVTDLQTMLASELVKMYKDRAHLEYDGLTTEEHDSLYVRRDKINTVKLVRQRSGMGLKEARDFVWDVLRKAGHDPDNYHPITSM